MCLRPDIFGKVLGSFALKTVLHAWRIKLRGNELRGLVKYMQQSVVDRRDTVLRQELPQHRGILIGNRGADRQVKPGRDRVEVPGHARRAAN
jgi:hypothetical protein